MNTVNALITVGATLVAIVAAAVWLRSSLVRQNQDELARLAQTRGERIEDLEKEVQELREHVLRLEGQVQALMSFKTEDVADAVEERLRPILEALM